MAYCVINLQRDTSRLLRKVTWVVVHWNQSKKGKERIDRHTMNTNFISTSMNWYWCGTITVFEDSRSQRKIVTHRIHERWFKVPKEICLGVFYFPPWKNDEEGKYIKQRNEGTCRPWAEEMLNQTADVSSAIADRNCHCPFLSGNKNSNRLLYTLLLL